MTVTNITIPPEAKVAAARRLYILNLMKMGHPHPEKAWEALPEEAKANVAKDVEAAYLAMLPAWQTEKHKMIVGRALDEVGGQYTAIILPLPPEPKT